MYVEPMCRFIHRPLTLALQNAGSSPELESMTGVDALLVAIGDPAGDDEPDRKSTAFQVCYWTRLSPHSLPKPDPSELKPHPRYGFWATNSPPQSCLFLRTRFILYARQRKVLSLADYLEPCGLYVFNVFREDP